MIVICRKYKLRKKNLDVPKTTIECLWENENE